MGRRLLWASGLGVLTISTGVLLSNFAVPAAVWPAFIILETPLYFLIAVPSDTPQWLNFVLWAAAAFVLWTGVAFIALSFLRLPRQRSESDD